MKKRENGGLRRWLAIQSTIIVIVSVMTFALLEYIVNIIMGWNPHYDPITCVGMIVPMAALMAMLSAMFNRRIQRYVSGLTTGLSKVANGDFSITLDVANGGPLQDAYRNFNIMTKELGSVQELRSDFINNFSHEFKTPITAIKGFAELLLEEFPSDVDISRQEYVRIIEEESTRLADLANSTLLLSKLESQQFVPEKNPYALDEQIKRCAILLSGKWEKKHIDFSADLSPLTFNSNEELMRHVWLNLLDNAIKYTPQDGEVTVTMTVSRQEILVSFIDNGIGMSQEVLEHIFDRYYQGDSSHTGKGLGLGLPIVHRIVELCGGSTKVTSTENQGSIFQVLLPCVGIPDYIK
ncbi:HAMP domain-containing sensor histidine kinase [Oscillibacter sp.]|uniref:HAMP domain-containing sensor histidine kinase n=1 Tax=Oscillibacter sp. TaxID=1945593 RepID=UPI0028979A17|nr:HAMP domain-containing sensor histidine kinase [Oscillibacter sp.]